MNATATTALFQAYVLLEDAAELVYRGDDVISTYSTSILYFVARGKIAKATELVLTVADELEEAAEGADAQERVIAAVRDARAAL